jgi:hypothetical protein
LVQKFSGIQEYNIRLSPLNICEILSLRKKDKKRLISIEMKFLRRTASYSLFDHKQIKKFWKR